MSQIRPVSDLRNNFADISRTVHETGETVILTKNGYGDMVIVSYEEYQRIQHELSVEAQLREAEWETRSTKTRFTHSEVMDSLRDRVQRVAVKDNV